MSGKDIILFETMQLSGNNVEKLNPSPKRVGGFESIDSEKEEFMIKKNRDLFSITSITTSSQTFSG